MDQIHKQLTTEQVKVLLEGHRQGLLNMSAIPTREEVQLHLGPDIERNALEVQI